MSHPLEWESEFISPSMKTHSYSYVSVFNARVQYPLDTLDFATNTLHRFGVTSKREGVNSWGDLRRQSLWLEEHFWTKLRLGLDSRVGTKPVKSQEHR